MHLLAHALQKIHSCLLLFVIPMRKIESGNIHAILNQRAERLFIVCIRSHRTYDFRLFHLVCLHYAAQTVFSISCSFLPAYCSTDSSEMKIPFPAYFNTLTAILPILFNLDLIAGHTQYVFNLCCRHLQISRQLVYRYLMLELLLQIVNRLI